MRLSAAPRWSGGHHPVGDATSGPVRLSFNPQLRVEFRGATVTSDAGLLLPRELDKRLGLDALIERHLTDPRTGHNRQFPLPDLVRQSIYSRLAGYEDTNDAERLAEDPTFRMLASRPSSDPATSTVRTGGTRSSFPSTRCTGRSSRASSDSRGARRDRADGPVRSTPGDAGGSVPDVARQSREARETCAINGAGAA